MISCDKGKVVIEGSSLIVSAELSTLIDALIGAGMSKSDIIHAVSVALEHPLSEKRDSAAKTDNEAKKDADNGAKSDDELAECAHILKEALDDFFSFLED
jgi:hypothetical protein